MQGIRSGPRGPHQPQFSSCLLFLTCLLHPLLPQVDHRCAGSGNMRLPAPEGASCTAQAASEGHALRVLQPAPWHRTHQHATHWPPLQDGYDVAFNQSTVLSGEHGRRAAAACMGRPRQRVDLVKPPHQQQPSFPYPQAHAATGPLTCTLGHSMALLVGGIHGFWAAALARCFAMGRPQWTNDPPLFDASTSLTFAPSSLIHHH